MYLSGDVGKGTEARLSGVIVNLKLSKRETKELKFRIISTHTKKKTSSVF